MEIHPDAYVDPEENDEWILPKLPDPRSVPDNTSSFLIFYSWQGQPNPRQRRISIALTREILPPWRRGVGIMCRWSQRAYAVGIWTPGKAPRILSGQPVEKDWRSTVARANELESK